MKKLSKSLLSILLILSMIAVYFVSPIMAVYADELVTITVDVNGGNELTTNTIQGPKGDTLAEIASIQDESWLISFMRTPKPRTYLSAIVNADNDEPIDPENDPIYEDIELKLIWEDATLFSGDIEVDADPPIIGDTYSIHPEEVDFGVVVDVQEPSPMINTDFDKFDIPFEGRRFLVSSCQGEVEPSCLVPLEGEVTSGQKYYLSFYIEINDNYYMSNDIHDVLKINGEAPTFIEDDDITLNEVNNDFIGAWVIYEMDPVQGGTLFTVEFNTDGGSEIAPVTVSDGELVGRPVNDPTKDNYVFAGWYADPQRTQVYDFNDPVHEPRVVYAKWEEKNVSISPSPNSVNFGDVQLEPENHVQRVVRITNDGNVCITLGVINPTNEGPFGTLSFNSVNLNPGEYNDVTVIVNKDSPKAAIAGDYSGDYVFTASECNGDGETTRTVHASVNMVTETPATHFVEFDTDGGTPVPAVVEVNHGASVPRPEVIPQKENVEFDEWCADETKTQVYDFSNSITADTTIYARYKPAGQGSGNDSNDGLTIVPNTIDFGIFNVGSTEDLTRDVTITNQSDVNVEVTVDIPSNGLFNIHAESNTFVIGARQDANLTLSVDHAAVLANTAGTYNANFVFNYNEVGVELGDSVTVPVTVTVADAPAMQKVTVTFDTDGGTPVPAPVEIDKGTAVSRPETNPQKENYTFDTWCADETKNVPYNFSSAVDADITLYARYNEITQGGGGNDPVAASVVVTPNEVDFGTFYIGSTSDLYRTITVSNGSNVDVEVTISSPTNEGPFYALETQTFVVAAGQEQNVSLIIDHGMAKAGIAGTYHGQYVFSYNEVGEQSQDEALVSTTVVVAEAPATQKVTVTFDTDGGTPVPAQVEIDKGSAVSRPETDPQKENYTFDTWCADETKNVPYNFSSAVDADITLYARYNEVVNSGSGTSSTDLEILDNTDNQSYNPESEGASQGLTIRVSGELSDLLKIEVDGVEPPTGAVELSSGSTIATFTPAYLNTLGSGSHTVTFYYGTSGNINATFNIQNTSTQNASNQTIGTTNNVNNPGTYDNIAAWFTIFVVSGIVLSGTIVLIRKKH